MIRFFAKSSDHPLADGRELRRLCEDLSRRDPQGAVEEAAGWLESLQAAEGFKPEVRLERLLRLDEALLAQVRRFGREYLTSALDKPGLERRAWEVAHGYWAQLRAGYARVLEEHQAAGKESPFGKGELQLLHGRLVHALTALLKWDQFRYGPVGAAFWAELGAPYLAAEAAGTARKSFALYPGQPATTLEAEYLKPLLFQASSTDKLVPLQIELAERLIAHLLPHFELRRDVRPENVYWVDAALPQPPTRLARIPEVSPSLRFFNGAAAIQAIEAILDEMGRSHQAPRDVNLGGQYEPEAVAGVLRHLATCWAPTPPMRRDARRRVESRLIVAHGLADACAYVSGERNDPAGVEFWTVDDVSLGGMGAVVPLGRQDWIRIGVLVAIQPEGGSNWLVGRVRRYAKLSAAEAQVGIETISRYPVAVKAEQAVQRGPSGAALVLDVPEVGETARMAIPPALYEDKVALRFVMQDKKARFHPQEVLERGADFLVVRFFVQSFS